MTINLYHATPSIKQLFFNSPLAPFLFDGKVAVERYVADLAPLNLEYVPADPEVERLMAEAMEAGREVVLVSAADREHVLRLRDRCGTCQRQ